MINGIEKPSPWTDKPVTQTKFKFDSTHGIEEKKTKIDLYSM